MDKTKIPMQRVQLDLDFELYLWVAKEVEKRGITRNELIRTAIREYMEKEGK